MAANDKTTNLKVMESIFTITTTSTKAIYPKEARVGMAFIATIIEINTQGIGEMIKKRAMGFMCMRSNKLGMKATGRKVKNVEMAK